MKELPPLWWLETEMNKVGSTPVVLLTQYYVGENAERVTELKRAFKANLVNPLIGDVVLMSEEEPHKNWPTSKKVTQISLGRRSLFSDYFDYANKHFVGRTCIVSNTDIEFDKSLKNLDGMPLDQRCLALRRWELGARGKLEETVVGGQDSWVFVPPIVVKADFGIGFKPSDWKLAYELVMAGITVEDLYEVVICRHHHARTTRPSRDRVVGDYLILGPGERARIVAEQPMG